MNKCEERLECESRIHSLNNPNCAEEIYKSSEHFVVDMKLDYETIIIITKRLPWEKI